MKKTLEIGKIIGAHGIKGEIVLFPLTDDTERLKQLKYILVDGVRFEISGVRFHKGNALITSPALADRNAAERLKGKFAAVYREDANPLQEGEYYIEDLKGLTIKDYLTGEEGKILDIIQNKLSSDIIEYEYNDKIYLMAFTRENVKQVNITGGWVTADFAAGVSR